MTPTKLTAFRLTEDDLAVMDAIQVFTGLRSRADVLRLALRQYARAEGIEVNSAKPTRRAKSGKRSK